MTLSAGSRNFRANPRANLASQSPGAVPDARAPWAQCAHRNQARNAAAARLLRERHRITGCQEIAPRCRSSLIFAASVTGTAGKRTHGVRQDRRAMHFEQQFVRDFLRRQFVGDSGKFFRARRGRISFGDAFDGNTRKAMGASSPPASPSSRASAGITKMSDGPAGEVPKRARPASKLIMACPKSWQQ